LQTCHVKSPASQVHDWVVYRLRGILGSVGHKVKIHKITPATGKERGDLEIKDYVVLQKPQEQDDRLPPPRTLILDFTMTHPRYDRSHLNLNGQITNISRSDGKPRTGSVQRPGKKKTGSCLPVVQDSAQEFFRHTITPYLDVSRIEFQLCCLWIRFVSQGVVCFHIVGFGGHVLDSQYTPRFFVDNLRNDSQVCARLHSK
jgi:hypothetical protein